jgi:hypothetical protein
MDRGNDHRNSMPPSGPRGAIEEVYNKYASLSTNPSKKKFILVPVYVACNILWSGGIRGIFYSRNRKIV